MSKEQEYRPWYKPNFSEWQRRDYVCSLGLALYLGVIAVGSGVGLYRHVQGSEDDIAVKTHTNTQTNYIDSPYCPSTQEVTINATRANVPYLKWVVDQGMMVDVYYTMSNQLESREQDVNRFIESSGISKNHTRKFVVDYAPAYKKGSVYYDMQIRRCVLIELG